MDKEELIEFEGSVIDVLPDGRFRVRLDNGHEILAYASGRMKKAHIRVLAGDRVTVEMTPYDLAKGRITFRHKVERHSGAGTSQKTAIPPRLSHPCRASSSASTFHRSSSSLSPNFAQGYQARSGSDLANSI